MITTNDQDAEFKCAGGGQYHRGCGSSPDRRRPAGRCRRAAICACRGEGEASRRSRRSGGAQQRVWIEGRRCQHVTSPRFGSREKEEVRALLIIADGGGLPSDHHSWFWGRVRLMLIVAHHGWATAIHDAQHADMDRFGIHLAAPAAAQPAVPPPPPSPPHRRRRRWPDHPTGAAVHARPACARRRDALRRRPRRDFPAQ